MSLSKIVEEINSIKPFVDENVEAGPYETMNARRGRKNQAIERMKQLRRQYRSDLISSAAFIIVTGEKGEAFTATAVEGFKCFVASPEEFYRDLATRIPKTLYEGKGSPLDLFDILGRHLEDKMNELDLSQYNQIVFRQSYRAVINNLDDLIGLVRTAVNEQVGAEIVGIQAATTLVNQAIERSHKALVTPIILHTDNEKLALDLNASLRKLRPLGVFTVVAGKGTKALKALPGVMKVKESTAEEVEAALTTISEAIKK